MTLIKAFGRESEAQARFNTMTVRLKQLRVSLDKKTNLIHPFQETATLTMLLLLISLAAFIFIKGQTGQVSQYLVFFIVARRSLPLFGGASRFKANMARMSAPTEKILDIFNDDGKFFIPEGTRVFQGLKRSIELRHLDFAYLPQAPVLRDISFTIKKGTMTAIVGPSGAGKSTIIGLPMRFYNCPPASIYIDDIDIREYNLSSLKEHIAFVSQEILLFNDTLNNNIIYGASSTVSHDELTKVIRQARLFDFITSLPDRIDTEIGDRGIKLSGGEKQRVSIARALLKGSEILILDEATSALDTHTEKLIQEAIEEAVKGRTTIVIAHRLSTIKNAGHIVVLEGGKIIEEGALEALLLKRGAFYRAWEEQKFY